MTQRQVYSSNSEAIISADDVTNTLAISTSKNGVITKLFDIPFGGGGGSSSQTLLAGPEEATITNASQSFADMGITIDANIKKLTIIAGGVTFSWANGIPAVAGTNPLTVEAIELNILKVEADLLEFIVAAGNETISVLQEG